MVSIYGSIIIQDEYDHEEKLYEQINENDYVFDAKISISDFNELMDMNLDDSDYETLGGFACAQLGKIPNAGERERLKSEELPFWLRVDSVWPRYMLSVYRSNPSER